MQQSAQNGMVTCVERLIRPADVPGVFPQGTPTFPPIAPAVRHPAFPVDLAYGVLPKDTALPRADSPAINWSAPEKLYLSHVITTAYVSGEHDTFDPATAQYTNRTLIYQAELDTAIPDYDPDLYTILPPVNFPMEVTRGFNDPPQLVTVIPKNTVQTPQPVAFSEQYAVEWPPGSGQWTYSFRAHLDTPFLWLWQGMTVGSDSILVKGAANTTLIAYASGERNGGCAIYGCNPAIHEWYGVSGSLGIVSTEHLWLRATQPAGPIISHIVGPPAARGGLVPSLTAFTGLGLVALLSAMSVGIRGANRNRSQRKRKKELT